MTQEVRPVHGGVDTLESRGCVEDRVTLEELLGLLFSCVTHSFFCCFSFTFLTNQQFDVDTPAGGKRERD